MTYLTKGGRSRVFDCSDAACKPWNVTSGTLVQDERTSLIGYVIGAFAGGLYIHMEEDIGASMHRSLGGFRVCRRLNREQYGDSIFDSTGFAVFSNWQRLMTQADAAAFRQRGLSLDRLSAHERPVVTECGLTVPDQPGVFELSIHDPETDSWGVCYVRWSGVLAFRISQIWNNGHDEKLRHASFSSTPLTFTHSRTLTLQTRNFQGIGRWAGNLGPFHNHRI